MKWQLTVNQTLMLFGAGLLFAFAGLYYNQMILTMGMFILFIVSIFLTMVGDD